MTAIIDNIKLRKVVNKVLSAPEKDIIEKITDQDVYQNSSGYFTILNECIYNDTETNFKGLFTDEECSTPYSSDAYTLNVTSAVIQFTSHPPTLWAKYLPGGSIIWAEDINHLTDAVKAVDNNALYKDGSIMMTGNLNMGGRNIINSGTINNINLSTHQHLGLDVDGTTQLTEDSISDLSMSKITGLQDALDTKQNNLPTQTGQGGKFLTTNGSTMSWGNQYMRNIGELVQSILPLNDSKLHLLDGSLLEKAQYSELYNYLFNNSSIVNYPSGVKITGNLQNNNGVLSGFSETAYADIPVSFTPGTQDWEVQLKLELSGSTSALRGSRIITITADGDYDSSYYIYIDNVGSQASYSGLGFYIQFDVLKTDGSRYSQTHYQDTPFPNSNHGDLTQVKWLRYGYLNSTFYIKCSTDGVNFTTVISDSIPDLLFYSFTKSFVRLGHGLQNTSYLHGTVDLNGCYIKYGEDTIWQGGISFARSESDFLTEETIWQSTEEYFGICGKFVLDITNQTIRLPKVNSILQGSITPSHVGDIIEAGLPNITGSPILGENNSSWSKMPPVSGAIYRASTKENKYAGASDSDNDYLAFDASLSNPIYGRSNTVQPQTTKVLHYMVVSK